MTNWEEILNKLIKTYIGFSIKSRSVVIGQDRLKASNEKIKLIMYCPSSSQNLKDLALRIAEKHKCKVFEADEMLENYVSIEGCKIIGFTNESLSGAIIKVAEEGENNGK